VVKFTKLSGETGYSKYKMKIEKIIDENIYEERVEYRKNIVDDLWKNEIYDVYLVSGEKAIIEKESIKLILDSVAKIEELTNKAIKLLGLITKFNSGWSCDSIEVNVYKENQISLGLHNYDGDIYGGWFVIFVEGQYPIECLRRQL